MEDNYYIGGLLTTNTSPQPRAKYSEKSMFIELRVGDAYWMLSTQMAEELVIDLQHAAELARNPR